MILKENIFFFQKMFIVADLVSLNTHYIANNPPTTCVKDDNA